MSPVPEHRIELLHPDELDALVADPSIVYVPWGAIEWHGPHLPVGVDGLTAQEVCLSAARETGGVVLPPVWLGTGTLEASLGSRYCIEIGQTLVRNLAREIVTQLAADGWRKIVVVAGHYGLEQMGALREGAASAEMPDSTRVDVVAVWELAPQVVPRDHAALGETCMTMAVDSSLVRLDRLPTTGDLTTPQHGVWGADPRDARRELARDMLSACVSGLVALMGGVSA